MRRFAVTLILVVWVGSAAASDLTCVMPFSLVDRWTDANGNAMYDDGEAYDPLLTGFVAPADAGLSLTLTASIPQQALIAQAYFLVALPPLGQGTPPQTGETWLRRWVSECAPYGVSSGDSLLIDPGKLFPALLEELNELIAADLNAYWDDETNTVKGSAFNVTPRLLAVSCFDPRYPPTSGEQYAVVTKIAVVFLESTTGPTAVRVRFVDNATETVATRPTTWGRIKSKYGGRE